MKVNCKFCGVHFKQDFDKTLDPKCNMWGDVGASNVSKELKRVWWDWLFSMPADQMLIKTGLNTVFSFNFIPTDVNQQFKNKVPGYEQMTEEEQQNFQREYFKDPKAMSELLGVVINNSKKNEKN